MLYKTPEFILAFILFIGILLSYFIGLRILRYQKKNSPDHESGGWGPLEGAMLGLISLLLSFTFNKSASNYDLRRKLLVEETNNIGTVIFRADLYPDSLKQSFRKDLKEYVNTRIQYYEAGSDENLIKETLQRTEVLSQRIWLRASQASQQPGDVKSMQMIPAVNNMMDSVSKREEARLAYTPDHILYLLFLLTCAGSFIVGLAGKSQKPNWIILSSYSLMTVMTVYIILDLDRPRSGMINTSITHENMLHLLDLADSNK